MDLGHRTIDYLPLSRLNQLEYCERRFWLMYVHSEMGFNAAVQEGIQQHERAHATGTSREGDTLIRRQVYLWSDRLRIAGFADIVEERDGNLVPVEYKRGRMGQWLNDHIQLCAQGLCLEERTGRTVATGEIFYWKSRRRVAVEFTPELCERTEAAIERAFYLLDRGQMPAPITNQAKCRDCSVESICLPREVRLLTKEKSDG